MFGAAWLSPSYHKDIPLGGETGPDCRGSSQPQYSRYATSVTGPERGGAPKWQNGPYETPHNSKHTEELRRAWSLRARDDYSIAISVLWICRSWELTVPQGETYSRVRKKLISCTFMQ